MARAEAKYSLTAVDRTKAAFVSFKRSIASAGKALGALTVGGAIAAGAGFSVLIAKGLELGDAIAKMSQRTGASVEFLSALRVGAELTGTSFDAATTALVRMQRSTREAQRGLKTQVQGFKDLGINIERFSKLSPERRFKSIANAVRRMEREMRNTKVFTRNGLIDQMATSAARADIETRLLAGGAAILGRNFDELRPLLRGGSAAFKDFAQAARENGEMFSKEMLTNIEEANDAFRMLSGAFSGMGVSLASALGPKLTEFAETLRTQILPILKEITSAVVTFANFAAKAVGFAGRLWGATFGVALGTTGPGGVIGAVKGMLGIGGDDSKGQKDNGEVIQLLRRTANGVERLQLGAQ